MMALWRFLTSHKTCAWTGLAFCLAGAAGSVVMGRYPELFSDMDAGILAEWFARKGLIAPAPTLWLYGLLPHVMHVAFLGVVLSHLASSIFGDRITGVAVPQGGFARVGSTGWILSLDRFDANRDPRAAPILVFSVLFTAANLIYLLPARREDA